MRRKAIKAPRVGNATKEDLEKTYRAALRSLQSVDDLVAAVMAALKDTGKLDNTVVIYTSDNGFLFGDHRLVGKTAAYEGSIKVPLLMRGPGIPEDQTRDQLVSNLDVTATIVDLRRRQSQACPSTASRSSRSLPTPMRPGGARFSSKVR